MSAPTRDDAIRAGLWGNDESREAAFTDLYAQYAEPLFFYVMRLPTVRLDAQSAEEVVNASFIQFAKWIDETDFDKNKPFEPGLRWIARRRAISAFRKRARIPNAEELSEKVYDHIADTEVGSTWGALRLDGEHRAAEIMRLFEAMIPRLPNVQKEVANCIARNFPDCLTEGKLARLLNTTPARAKGARAAVRRKFKKILDRARKERDLL